NRGALLRNGVRLPVELRITGDAGNYEGILKKAAAAAGLEPVRGGSPRYTLTLGMAGIAPDGSGGAGTGTVSCELYDGGRGITLFKQNLPLPSADSSRRSAFARALRDGIFNAF
ncbi:MAG: hypothetical protein FWC45_08525, partial [Treponema sp.]|nr:hypothetical protein [Treponema sp.]